MAVHGEGGMGKTSLVAEFGRLCASHNIDSIYLDMQRVEEPVTTILDFMRIMRQWISNSQTQRLIGKEPFADFDASYLRLLGLEKALKTVHEKTEETPTTMMSCQMPGHASLSGSVKIYRWDKRPSP